MRPDGAKLGGRAAHFPVASSADLDETAALS